MGEGIRNNQPVTLREHCRLAALEEDDPELCLLALGNVAEGQGGIASLAEKTKLNRAWNIGSGLVIKHFPLHGGPCLPLPPHSVSLTN